MEKQLRHTLHTGRTIPCIGLGTWQMDSTKESVLHALDVGYRLIDTSSDYGTQPGIGEAIQETTVPRDELFITTKVEETDDAYKAAQEYVRDMQLEYADLLLIHRPPQTGAGTELWEGLIRAQEEGITRDIGVSNYSRKQIDILIENTGVTPVLNQIEWSPFGHDMVMLNYAKQYDMYIQSYSPLTRTERFDNQTLQTIASHHQKSPAQIMVRWNLQLGTIPIPKADEQSHLEENIDVFDFELSDDEMNQLHNLNEEYSSLGDLPYT